MEENIRDLIGGTGNQYTIPDCFFTSQREGNGRWWDDVQDDRNEEVAVSRMSFLDADYHMDYWGRRRIPPGRTEGFSYRRMGLLNDCRHTLEAVRVAGRRGKWVTGHSSLTTTDKDRAFAGNVLAPIMLDDWRGVSAISLDALSHRLLNIRGTGREVWPVVRVESSRAYGVWEDRCRAVRAELYPDFSYHGVPLSLRSYRPSSVSDLPTSRALGGPLFEVGIGIARLPGDTVLPRIGGTTR
jgi:hypothetical protein